MSDAFRGGSGEKLAFCEAWWKNAVSCFHGNHVMWICKLDSNVVKIRCGGPKGVYGILHGMVG